MYHGYMQTQTCMIFVAKSPPSRHRKPVFVDQESIEAWVMMTVRLDANDKTMPHLTHPYYYIGVMMTRMTVVEMMLLPAPKAKH